MIFNMTKIAAGLVLAVAATSAQAVAVSSITITGGTFSMGQPDTTPGVVCTGSESADFGSCHALLPGADNTITAGETGSPKLNTTAFAPDIVSFKFFGSQRVTTGLAPTALGAQPANDWALGFSGDATGGVLKLNLGGWYANWTGTNFLQGTNSTGANGTSVAATGTIDAAGNFNVTWNSYIQGGPFDTQNGYWRLTGTAVLDSAAPIPEASTYGMMLAGLGLVGGMVARRRKLMA